MDWPSRDLSRRLAEWSLCSPRDLERCRPFVRRMSRDVTAFDSIWIDALVHGRKLTPFQGRVLDSDQPQRLQIGHWVLTDRLDEDAWRSVYRARALRGDQRCLLTVHRPHADERPTILERLRGLISRGTGLECPALSVISSGEFHGDALLTTSPDIEGPTLKDLLIRRGRFPAAVVLSLARQLLGALVLLEQRGIVHGDLRLRNVRLVASGEPCLLQPGLLPALNVYPEIVTGLPVDLFDGLAPELGGGTIAATSQSDLYALGCLIWQLLAGRPPFISGDPLAKFAAHRNRSVPDVLTYAPDTPRPLVELIRRTTANRPEHRPTSALELLSLLKPAGGSDRRKLRRFLQSFQGEPPRQTLDDSRSHRSHLSTALTVAILGGVVWYVAQADLSHFATTAPTSRSPVASETALGKKSSRTTRPTENAAHAASSPATSEGPSNQVQPAVFTAPAAKGTDWPSQEADGTIWLTSGNTYRPEMIEARGAVRLQGSDGPVARIVVPPSGWELNAEDVHLENVEILLPAGAPWRVRSQRLKLTRCRIVSEAGSPTRIEWSPAEPSSASASVIAIEACQFQNVGLSLGARPAVIRAAHCLKTGAAAFFEINASGRPHQTLQLQMTRSTLRRSGPLVRWSPGPRAAGLRVDVHAHGCVFDIEDLPLLELAAKSPPPEWDRTITLTGLETILTPESRLVGMAEGGPALDGSQISVDGILTGNARFKGDELSLPSDSLLTGTDAVRSTRTLPGFDSSKLPDGKPSPRLQPVP